ncbi:MAG: DNA mismatch repair protein MutL [Bacteriovoracaceae bacterium]|jgi:DNA mismatch repair protein MutL
MDIVQKNRIQLLPEHIIDQIKAGEVIERPSTLIKEIIENSIDAGSTKIELHLIDNGLELISLIDNGKGISAVDLPLAFCRHATSKIDRFEDIYHLHSYGFRGEALASIASISKVSCETQTSTHLGLIKIEGGETLTHQEEDSRSKKTGTKLFIRDLFYNTPVRMKFIQSKTSEKNQLKKIINAFLLTHPEIEFSVKWDDKEKDFYPIKNDIKDRVKDVLFKSKEIHFHEVENSYDGVNFKVLLTHQSTRGNAHKSHFLFINDRYVQDFQIHKIILNSASHIWPEGESGHYVAFLDLPADEIDVNIHPNKTVIKLFRAPKVFSVVSGSIKNSFQKHNINTRVSQEIQYTNELPLETQSPEFKDIEYHQVDFTQSHKVSNYFEDLHSSNKTQDSDQLKSLFTFPDYSLYNFNNQLYLLKKNSLINFDLHQIIQSRALTEEIIPLLVSRPIKTEKKLNRDQLSLFGKLGYELDHLDNKTLVIRSFPKELQRFPYLKIAEYIINQRFTNKEEIDFSNFNFDDYNEAFLNDIIMKYPFSRLLENKAFIQLEQKDMAKFYGK